MERAYCKKTGHWVVVQKKEPKTYPNIRKLQSSIVEACLLDKQPMSRKTELAADDPRHIAPNIAPIIPPPTSEMIKQKWSRFGKKDTTFPAASTSVESQRVDSRAGSSEID